MPILLSWQWESSDFLVGVLEALLGRSQLGFQSLQIVNDNASSIDLYQAFRLEAGKISGNQLADRSDLLVQARGPIPSDRTSTRYRSAA